MKIERTFEREMESARRRGAKSLARLGNQSRHEDKERTEARFLARRKADVAAALAVTSLGFMAECDDYLNKRGAYQRG